MELQPELDQTTRKKGRTASKVVRREQLIEATTEIDKERRVSSVKLCHEIKETGAFDHLNAEHVADTLEGLFDGFCLNILIYPGEFGREDAKDRVRSYLSNTFPGFSDGKPPCRNDTKP